jgi:hypothetical protein
MPDRERLLQQFEINKSKFERAKAKADADRKSWGKTLGGLAISGGLFMGGAAVEAGTKFFKDSIPPRIKNALCHLSDGIRSNQYPQQFTIVVLPHKDDIEDQKREQLAESLRLSSYHLNLITPCVPVRFVTKGSRKINTTDYLGRLDNTLTAYRGDLLIIGEVKDKIIKLNSFAKRDIRDPQENIWRDDDPRDPIGPFDLYSFPTSMEGFLSTEITRTLTYEGKQVICDQSLPPECAYSKDTDIGKALLYVSKIADVFLTDYPLDIPRPVGLWENRDYYEQLDIEQKKAIRKPTVEMASAALPVILNLIFKQNRTTYVDSDGLSKPLFGLACLISWAYREAPNAEGVSAFLKGKRAEACRSSGSGLCDYCR